MSSETLKKMPLCEINPEAYLSSAREQRLKTLGETGSELYERTKRTVDLLPAYTSLAYDFLPTIGFEERTDFQLDPVLEAITLAAAKRLPNGYDYYPRDQYGYSHAVIDSGLGPIDIALCKSGPFTTVSSLHNETFRIINRRKSGVTAGSLIYDLSKPSSIAIFPSDIEIELHDGPGNLVSVSRFSNLERFTRFAHAQGTIYPINSRRPLLRVGPYSLRQRTKTLDFNLLEKQTITWLKRNILSPLF